MGDPLLELLADPKTRRQYAQLPEPQREAFAWRTKWLSKAHDHQILPPGDWWTIWLLLAGRGAGKQLCVDTPIPTPDGWVRNGDLKAGDKVFDERGRVCSVVQAHPITNPQTAYRVTFVDGSYLDADGEHLWTTLTHRARKQMTRHGVKRVPDDWATYRHSLIDCHHNVTGEVGAETLTTQQIKDTFTHSARGDLNHCIPTAQPLVLPEVALPIDPYLLGSWLGDGSSKEQVIWGHAEDIGLIDGHAKSLGYETQLQHDQGNTWKVRIIGLSKQLRQIGVYGNKHVPALYLRASIDQRLALLRGLMDTDGYQDKKSAEFCNTNVRLAEAVYELAVSLGEKPVMKESRAKLNGRDCGEKYRVTWRWNRFNPFLMDRKRLKMAAPDGQSFKHGHRMIVSIEPIEPKPMRCITVDSSSRLYLAGEAMIPTHNTRTAAEQVAWWAWTEPGTRWLVAAPTSADVRSTCFEGDSGLMSVIPATLIAEYNKALHELKLVNGSLIKGIPASEPERFRGPQFHGAWCCSPGTMIEMADGPAVAIETLKPGDVVATRYGPRKVLAAGISGNPNDRVAIECGATRLIVTVDHPILVGDQWIPAGDIKAGDFVWATNTSVGVMLTESFTSGTSGQSQKDGLSIIKTKTKATTIQATWKRCREKIISVCTQPEGKDQKLNAWLRPKHWLLYARQSLQRAFAAVLALCPIPQVRLESFAQEVALNAGGATDLSQSKETALFAAQNTQRSNDSSGIAAKPATTNPKSEPIALRQLEVLRVERLPNSVTYNLTVEGEHEFIANGIVVHNCDELAAWDYLQEAWDQIMFGVRLGKKTRILCTTTPKPKDLIIELVGRDGDDVKVTTATTYENLANLAPSFQKQILQYEGTKLGRQEIYAEIIDPEESGIIKRDMIKLWPSDRPFPRFEYVIQSYDCATSEKTSNDPTAAATWGVFKPQDGPMSVMLMDCWQDRLQYPDLRPKVQDEYEVIFGEGKDRKRVDLILIEDKSAGISLIQDLQRAHLPVRAYNPGHADKLQRLNIVSSLFARGRVWMPESSQRPGYVRDWAEPLLSQLCSFPDTTHDDFVDATTQALRFLRDAGFIDIDGPAPETYDEDDYIDSGQPRRVNPYAV